MHKNTYTQTKIKKKYMHHTHTHTHTEKEREKRENEWLSEWDANKGAHAHTNKFPHALAHAIYTCVYTTIYEMCSKSIEMNNDWNFFFKITVSFLLVEAPLKHFFLYHVKVNWRIYLNIIHVFRSYPWDEISLEDRRKSNKHSVIFGEYGGSNSCTIPCFVNIFSNISSLVSF